MRDKERQRENHRKWCAANRDRLRETHKVWRMANLDKVRAAANARRQNHPEATKSREARYRAKNKEKIRRIMKKHYTKKRQIIKAALTGCVDRLDSRCFGRLEFDHVRGPKLFSVGAALTRSYEALNKEIAKCEVRCEAHHAAMTAQRKADGLVLTESGWIRPEEIPTERKTEPEQGLLFS